MNGKWDMGRIGQSLVDIKEDVVEIKRHVEKHTDQLSTGTGKISANKTSITWLKWVIVVVILPAITGLWWFVVNLK